MAVKERTIDQNVDLKKLGEFRSFLEDNPDKAKLHLRAKAIYGGQVGRSTVHIGPYAIDDEWVDRPTRHYTIPFGAWREVEDMIGVGGPTDRMEPVEMALAATAACVINSITFNTARMGIDTEGLEITVDTIVDPRVLFAVKGPEAHPSCLGTINYEVKVTGDVSDQEMDTIQKLCAHSPVHGLMAEAINVSATVVRA